MKNLLFYAFLIMCFSSNFAQNIQNEFSVIKTVDSQIQAENFEISSTTSNSILLWTENNSRTVQAPISDEAWKMTLQRIKQSKERFVQDKSKSISIRILDTIILPIPEASQESRLSGW
ncbi:hypothetical protein [Aquimarina intermedia]|uniref:Uncharacterized protein n=1 Tax=Aquimarina intermedia TaxID=350814 RepID=A0A5S5CD40_9FLAO|nr:hypothetical protein [Aquimarina intermedia]TYP75913.1 hypothetical protein BD809_102124 [Aquimarina intermedia]